MTAATPKTRSRDRQATEKALVQAACEVLAEAGFQGFGVNAVARRAGCDKQLIYRYFGGLDGLVEAIGAEIAAALSRSLAPFSAMAPPQSYAELAERMLLGFLETLRADPLMQRIMAWEIAGSSPLLQRITLARSRAMMAWFGEIRGRLQAPEGVDAPAVNALLIAGVQHLVLSASAAGQFAGLPLRDERAWERVRSAARALVAAAYPEGGRTPPPLSG